MNALQFTLNLGETAVNNNNRKMMLMDCQLPEYRESRIKSILKKNDLNFAVPDVEWPGQYNCWGYVAFNLGWEEKPVWLKGETMDDHLALYTKPIAKEEVRAGDIAVFRRGDYLTHTALMTHEPEIICHKPGANELCVDTMQRAIGMYGDEVTYVRPIAFPC